MNRISHWVFVCLLFVFPAQSGAQMGNADVRFVSDDCFAVLQFDMQKLLPYEKMGSKNLEIISRSIKKTTRLDLMAMKTLTIQFCAGEGDNEEIGRGDFFGFAMTFSSKIDQGAFLEGLGGRFSEAEFEGIKFHDHEGDFNPSVCFLDDRTVVMAMKPTLQGMIGKKSSQSKIRGLLKSADPGAEVKGAFRTHGMYELFLDTISEAIPVKPFNIQQVFGQAQTAVFSGKLKSGTPIHLQVECKTEKGAETLAKKGQFLVDLGKATIPIGRESIETLQKEIEGKELGGFDRFQVMQFEMQLHSLELAETVLAAAETSSNGKMAYLKVKQMGGFRELIPLVVKLFSSQFEAMEELEKGIVEPLEGIDEAPEFDDEPQPLPEKGRLEPGDFGS